MRQRDGVLSPRVRRADYRHSWVVSGSPGPSAGLFPKFPPAGCRLPIAARHQVQVVDRVASVVLAVNSLQRCAVGASVAPRCVIHCTGGIWFSLHVLSSSRYTTPESLGSDVSLRSGTSMCVPGEFCVDGLRHLCPGGTFAASSGASNCDPCPAGTVGQLASPLHSMVQTPVNTTLLLRVRPCWTHQWQQYHGLPAHTDTLVHVHHATLDGAQYLTMAPVCYASALHWVQCRKLSFAFCACVVDG